MNLQSILQPMVAFFQWTFKYMLEPLGNSFNYLCILGGFFGLFLWLRMQKKFTAKSKQEGGII